MTPYASKDILFYCIGSFITLAAVAGSKSSWEKDQFCRQKIFVPVEDVFQFNVSESLHVETALDCGHQCLMLESCDSFRHRTASSLDEVNCQTVDLIDTSTQAPYNEVTAGDWTLYKIQLLESPLCPDNFCENGGTCVPNACESEGYSCSCDRKYRGKQCENENHDFDITFPRQSGNNYIKMEPIKSRLSEFTFTCWLKTVVGSSEYPLLLYTTNETSKAIDIYFNAAESNGSNVPIYSFSGDIFNTSVSTATIPVNDGYWHHIGLTWSGYTGDWTLLIDGVLWALRSSIQTGKHLPEGGSVIIGQRKDSPGISHSLVGSISRVGFWDVAKNGGEIAAMAKGSGDERGNLISWFTIVDYVTGNLSIDRPSQAAYSGEGTDYEIALGTNYAIYPGPSEPLEHMSSCLWFRLRSSPLVFFAYNSTQQDGYGLAFGYGKSGLVLYINNVLVENSDVSPNSYWHFLCVTWNGEAGKVVFYYDGRAFEQNTAPRSKIRPGGNITVGVLKNESDGSYSLDQSLSGRVSQLNIWAFVMKQYSIIAMSAGGANINGNILSWKRLGQLVVGNTAKDLDIYLPGFAVLEKRTKWCNRNVPGASCVLYARLGSNIGEGSMQWRCYCGRSLLPAKFTFSFSASSQSYFTRHSDLTAITE